MVSYGRCVLRDADYEDLLALRTGLRRFLRWSEQQAEAAGLTPAQHQLLLAIRGHPDRRGPTVGEVADYLLLRHHSAVGLVDRAVAAKLVKRVRDPQDHRIVRLQLTAAGSKRLEALSEAAPRGARAAGPHAAERLARPDAAPAPARHRDAGLTDPDLLRRRGRAGPGTGAPARRSRSPDPRGRAPRYR